MQQILSQFPGLKLGAAPASTAPASTAPVGKENTPPTGARPGLARNLEASFNSVVKEQEQKPLQRSNTFKKEQDPVVLPPAALGPLHLAAWTRLNALARGHLTRRLLASERVLLLRRTITETLACAVQLHHEAEGKPSKQELELHARLLAQLEAACVEVHHIFITLPVKERMQILASDREAKQARSERSEEEVTRPRLSAATAARLASKAANGAQAGARFEARRRRVVLSSRASLRSPRSRMVRSIHSGNVMTRSVGSLGSSKPSWK